MKISVCNVLKETAKEMHEWAVNDGVVIELQGDQEIVAVIPRVQ
jgi:molybdopterin-binding protein